MARQSFQRVGGSGRELRSEHWLAGRGGAYRVDERPHAGVGLALQGGEAPQHRGAVPAGEHPLPCRLVAERDSSSLPRTARWMAAASSPGLSVNTAYTLGSETPAWRATSATVVRTYPRSANNSAAACSIRARVCAACAWRLGE